MDKQIERFQKSMSFMDTMIRWVFFGTFIFTAIVFVFAWHFAWESILSLLIDNWFRIMVSELLIMGVIQIGKQIAETLKVKIETQADTVATDGAATETSETGDNR